MRLVSTHSTPFYLPRLYVGYGKKAILSAYIMPPPPPLPEEFDDMPEQIDPTLAEEIANRPKPAEEEGAEEDRAAEENAEEAE